MFKIPFLFEGLSNLFKKPLTDEKPVEDYKGSEGYRGKIEFTSEKCIGCGICIRVCAGDAIVRKIKPIDGGQDITMEFDLASCTFCGLCKDFCPKKAIELSNEIFMISEKKENLKVTGSFIKKLPPKAQVKPKVKVEDNKK